MTTNKLNTVVAALTSVSDDKGHVVQLQGGRFRVTDDYKIIDTGVVGKYASKAAPIFNEASLTESTVGPERTYNLNLTLDTAKTATFIVPGLSASPVTFGFLYALAVKPLPLPDSVLLQADSFVPSYADDMTEFSAETVGWSVDKEVTGTYLGEVLKFLPAPAMAAVSVATGDIIQLTDGEVMKEGDHRDSILIQTTAGTLGEETRGRVAAIAAGIITLDDEQEVVFFDNDVTNVHSSNLVASKSGEVELTLVTTANDPDAALRPTASFTHVKSYREVMFTSATTESGLTFAWDFGDTNTSTDENPTHTYADDGRYEVKLIVTNADGYESIAYTESVSVRENRGPVAAFSVSVDDLGEATFKDMSRDADGTVASYAWDFGDSSSSTDQNPVHAYPAANADFDVTLTVTDDQGLASLPFTKKVSVVIPNALPVADFTTVNTYLSVAFTDATTDGDGTVTNWLWDFGDGVKSTEQNPTHVFATAGDYDVSLVAYDNLLDASEKVTKTITVVANVPPVADFTSATSFLEATFTDASTDGDGTVVAYAWDFGDGTTSTDQNPVHTYAAADTYTVTLTVTDNFGATHEVSNPVTVVANVPPTADFSNVATFLSVDFTDASTDTDGTVDSFLWDFGDGSTSTDQNPTHVFASADTYQVKLVVTDDQGDTGEVTKPVIVVANEAPTADFTFAETYLDVQFTDASSDTDGSIVSYAWDFGDGNSSTDQSPLHTYASDNTYNVKLTVTDDQGDTGEVTKAVTVAANVKPVASFTNAINGLEVTFTDTSSDSDGTVNAWAWDFGDTNSSTDQNPVHTFAGAGTYDVKLTVTDADGLASDQVTVQVTV